MSIVDNVDNKLEKMQKQIDILKNEKAHLIQENVEREEIYNESIDVLQKFALGVIDLILEKEK